MPTTVHQLLIVDDEQDMAHGLRRLLQLKGYNVEVAHSGEDAVSQAQRQCPDGILMDLKMPGMDGVEAYRRIHASCPNAFVIFMTAFSSLVGQARDERPIGVLTKPLDPDVTCDLIANAFAAPPESFRGV